MTVCTVKCVAYGDKSTENHHQLHSSSQLFGAFWPLIAHCLFDFWSANSTVTNGIFSSCRRLISVTKS